MTAHGSLLFGAGALALAFLWFTIKAIAGHWLAHKIFASLTRRRGRPGYTRSNPPKETKNDKREVGPRS
jgi:hypothetical protein